MINSSLGTPKNITATTTFTGNLLGFYVNSTSSGTLVFTSSGPVTTISGTITPAVGWHWFPIADMGGTVTATVGGTLNATLFIA